jgi:hypothetical protein
MSKIDMQEKQSSEEEKDLLTARMNSQLKGARNQYVKPAKPKKTIYRAFGLLITAAIIISILLAIFKMI